MAKITIHTPEEIEAMRRVGAEAADLLDFITPHVKAGVSTLALDELMLEYTVNVLKAKSACLGYNPGNNGVPYPRATCISVNNVICHGIPSEKKILKNGDIVNIDVTIEKDGFFGDNSRMFIIGKPTIAGKRLVEATWVACGQVSRQYGPATASMTLASPALTSSSPWGFRLCTNTAATASDAFFMLNRTSAMCPSAHQRPNSSRV